MKTDHQNDEGSIKQVSLYDKWERCGADSGRDFVRPRLIKYRLRCNHDVTLNFFFRGNLLHPTCAKSFLHILSKPPHDLQPDEQALLAPVLRDAAYKEWFAMERVRTEILHDRTVLVAEGKWLSTGLMNLGVFLNADENAEAIQEIHYLAPEVAYKIHIGEAVTSISNIDWDDAF